MFFARDFLALESLGAANPFPVLAGAEFGALAPIAIGQEQYASIDQMIRMLADEFAGAEPGRDVMVRASLTMLLATLGRIRPVVATEFCPSLVQR